MTTEAEDRKRFEQWAREWHLNVTRGEDEGNYHAPAIQIAWMAWRAAQGHESKQ